MAHRSSIFHNIVTDEDSTTEVLCNLMRFSAFRHPLLAKLFSPECAAGISFDDIDTQVDLGGFGRADIAISNENVSAIVEVKVEQYHGLTGNQPNGYLSYLAKERASDRWLVFLVPPRWVHLPYLEQALQLSSAANRGIRTRVLSWEDVVSVIDESDLQELSPFIDEFYQLLLARIRPTPIVFSAPEVVMLFSKEFPTALSKLDGLIGEIQKKSSMYKSQQQRAGRCVLKNTDCISPMRATSRSCGSGLGPSFGKKKAFPCASVWTINGRRRSGRLSALLTRAPQNGSRSGHWAGFLRRYSRVRTRWKESGRNWRPCWRQ